MISDCTLYAFKFNLLNYFKILYITKKYFLSLSYKDGNRIWVALLCAGQT